MNDFNINDLKLTRSELRAKHSIDELKQDCMDLQDQEEGVQCLNLANEMDNRLDELIKESMRRKPRKTGLH